MGLFDQSDSGKHIPKRQEQLNNHHRQIRAEGQGQRHNSYTGWQVRRLALYMDDGKPAYTYNWFGLDLYTVKSLKAIPKGIAEVKLDIVYDGDGLGKGGMATLYADGKKVAEGRIDKTQPMVFSADETADVGKDDATQVVPATFKDVRDSIFTGNVKKIEVSIPEKK